MSLSRKRIKRQTKDVTSRTPKVSILISVYNSELTIKDSLESIKHQIFEDYEIIIINDASTDQTGDIIENWTNNNVQKTTIVTNRTNLGLTKSLNLALTKSKGKYIARLDADDTWHPAKLEKQIAELEAAPYLGVIGSWYQTDLSNHTITTKPATSHSDIQQSIFRSNPFGHSCVVIRKHLLEQVSGYDESIELGQDRDLWFRLLPLTTFQNIPEVLCYRKSDDNLSSTRQNAQMIQGIRTRLKYIYKYQAPKRNYLFLIEPLLIIITPTKIKNLLRRVRHKRITDQCNVMSVNDRPLIATRAETVARLSMAKALSKHPKTKKLLLVYPGELPSNTIKSHHKTILSAHNNLLGVLFTPIPNQCKTIYLRCGAIAAFIFTIRAKKQIKILEVHNKAFGRNPIINLLYHFAMNRCHKIITISEDTKQDWISRKVKPDKILVLPSGVSDIAFDHNQSKAQLRQKLSLPQDKQIVIYAGNLYQDRGIEDILAAAQQLNNDNINFILIGGRNEDIKHYQSFQGEKFPHLSNVSYLGYQPSNLVHQYLQAADIVLITYSKACPTANTMSPLKLVEGLASKTPLIIADIPRLKDLANSEQATWYTPDDSQDLAEKIKLVFNKPEQAHHKAISAFQKANQFTWTNRASIILSSITSPT